MKALGIFLVFFMTPLFALMAKAPLDSAASAYMNGNYPESIRIYSDIAKNSGVSAELLADLGNAYVKSGDLGQGLICYERSLRLDPGNKSVKGNIRYINSKVEDKNIADAAGKKVSVVPEDKGFFYNVRNYIVNRHTSDFWSTWGAVLFILSCACCACYIFLSDVLLRKIGFFGGFICLGISIILVVFSFWTAAREGNSGNGVVTGYKVTLLNEPFSNSKVVSNPLNRGTKLDVLDIEDTGEGKGKWYKVRLNSDYEGWIRSSDFELI